MHRGICACILPLKELFLFWAGDVGMRVVKNINNNVSLCLDSRGREVVAFGRGVGFARPPYDLPIEKIERTFYNIKSIYVDMIADIPEEIMNLSSDVVDYANELLGGKCNPNVVFTLADHIWFAIKRNTENIRLKFPLLVEARQMYANEMRIGQYAVRLIRERLNLSLSQDEATTITLHIVDYGLIDADNFSTSREQTRIEKCTEVVEKYMGLEVDRSGFAYSRFVSHMYYLLGRLSSDRPVDTENQKMFEALKEEYPEIYYCAVKISEVLGVRLNNEELLYLILHINRLCAREDCDR